MGTYARWWVGVAGLLLPIHVNAQSLDPARWEELILLEHAPDLFGVAGADPEAPEDIADSTSVSGFSLSGTLTYGPPGPPSFTAYAYGRRSAVLDLQETNASTEGVVTFQLVVRQIAEPPAAVTRVPVSMKAMGSTRVRGSVGQCPPSCILDADPAAFGSFRVATNTETLIFRTVTSASFAGSNNLNLLETHQVLPDEIVTGTIQVVGTVRMTRTDIDDWGEATASIGVEFAVSSSLIPGTAAKFSEFFQIEYSPGYWALGNPTPVTPTTWGRLKRLYSN
ncbi:MAG TPA: hypothetical protein VFP10_03920 [Candidatus Eisenbacteria bacterium]|nr:hypothetical protein [Candidatus Eisenbacteria bacterium]